MISVIIPTCDRASFLDKAVKSVLSQTYGDFELVIVDDGSKDDTSRVVSGFYDPRIRYIIQDNKGPAAARNLGIRNAKGDYLAFLDSDDWWCEEKLGAQLNEMEKRPGYFISHTQEIWYKNGALLNQKKKHEKHHGYIFDRCLPLCVVSMSTAMIKKGLFDEVGLFDEAMPCCEDYDFWLRASVKYEFLLIDKPLTLKDGGRKDQVSSIYATGIDRFRIKSISKILKSGLLNEEQKRQAVKELRKKCRIYGNGCLRHGRIEEGRYYLGFPDIEKDSFNPLDL